MFPTATAHAFGKAHFGANYGLIFTSQAVAGVVGGLLSSDLVRRAAKVTTTTAATTGTVLGAELEYEGEESGLAAAPTTPGGCVKGSHEDDYLPALLAVGGCTAAACILAIVFLLRGGSRLLPYEPLAIKRARISDGAVN